MTSTPRHRYRGPRLALLAGLIVLAATVTQCRMVTDAVTRPDTGADVAHRDRDNNGNKCFKKCLKEMFKALDDEEERHEENMDDCGRNKACKRAEIERYKAAIKQIIADRKKCQEECHHQGGGRGGR